MKTMRTELKTKCMAIICFDMITILDKYKTVILSLYKEQGIAFAWREDLRAYENCTVQLDYHNHLLEDVFVFYNDEIIASLSFDK